MTRIVTHSFSEVLFKDLSKIIRGLFADSIISPYNLNRDGGFYNRIRDMPAGEIPARYHPSRPMIQPDPGTVHQS